MFSYPRGALQTHSTGICLELSGLTRVSELVQVRALGGAVALGEVVGPVGEGWQTVNRLEQADREHTLDIGIAPMLWDLFVLRCRLINLVRIKFKKLVVRVRPHHQHNHHRHHLPPLHCVDHVRASEFYFLLCAG